MKNKKGFTLVELLAVIAILSILALLVVPNAIGIFGDSRDKFMVAQENQILDASKLFLDDYCNRNALSNYRPLCDNYYKLLKDTTDYTEKYVCIKSLKTAAPNGNPYYKENLEYDGDKCFGSVVVRDDKKTNKTISTKVYIMCSDDSGSVSYTNENAKDADYASTIYGCK